MSHLLCGGAPGKNDVWGEGRLDAFAAVTKAKGPARRLRTVPRPADALLG